MIIQFDKEKMHIQVLVGVLEEYQPSESIKELQLKVESLKQKISEFYKTEINSELMAIEKIIKEENSKFIPSK